MTLNKMTPEKVSSDKMANDMTPSIIMIARHDRYHTGAILLHWVMALAFFLMLGSGFALAYLDIPKHIQFSMIQLHKSFGIVLLWAVFLRIVWRLWHKPPVLTGFSRWENILSRIGHIALYICMLAMPLSGWLMVSSNVYGLPTILFNLFEWPHIPFIAANEVVNSWARFAHMIFAYGFTAMIFMHIAAVIKHDLLDKNPVLYRMLWSKK